MISNYARKQILKKVVAQFTDSEIEWLATQDEFNKLYATSVSFGDMVDLGKKLLKQRPPVRKFENPIAVPDLVAK